MKSVLVKDLSEEQHRFLKMYGADYGLSMSQVVHILIDSKISEYERLLKKGENPLSRQA